MERDLRLTGSLRGQSTNVEAPKGFELSNPWKVSYHDHYTAILPPLRKLTASIGRKTHLLDLCLIFVSIFAHISATFRISTWPTFRSFATGCEDPLSPESRTYNAWQL
ncbi:hypothetical protein BJX62DRAFT_170494 [Aspergillus germanicus]